jgi:hypothetical protein
MDPPYSITQSLKEGQLQTFKFIGHYKLVSN